QVGPRPGTEADRDVDGIALEIGVAQRRLDPQLDARVQALEVRQVWDEPALGERLERTHAQRAGRRHGETSLGAPQLAEDAVHDLEIAPALLGDLQPWVEA